MMICHFRQSHRHIVWIIFFVTLTFMSLKVFPNSVDKIDDLLYIGCRAGALQCKAMGFTHRVQLSSSCSPSPDSHDGVTPLLYIQLDDDEDASLDEALSVFLPFIQQRDSCVDRVLLHCDAGISRSASLALVYLMAVKKYRLSDAFAFLLKCRPCVQPNSGFMAQLDELDTSYQGVGRE
jgi:hypothetical protein